jgi:hypothetical protein
MFEQLVYIHNLLQITGLQDGLPFMISGDAPLAECINCKVCWWKTFPVVEFLLLSCFHYKPSHMFPSFFIPTEIGWCV